MQKKIRELSKEIKTLVRRHVIERGGGMDYSKLEEQIFLRIKKFS